MPWINREHHDGTASVTRPVRGIRWFGAFAFCAASVALVIFVFAVFLSGAAPEKHLSVYSLASNYSVPLVQRGSRDYVGLLELLEPLGSVSAKTFSGQRWRLRYKSVEGEFFEDKNHARIQGRDADLNGKFLLENDRGYVPVSCLNSLLPRILGGPVTLHEDAGRLFIGSVATHFTASLAGDNPPRLVFNFTAPVNPTVSTDAGSLRMNFSHEPLVAPASPTLTFGNKMIPSATYTEGNGGAMITVNSTQPVIASFSNDGRTVTITSAPTGQKAPVVAQQNPSAPLIQPETPAPSNAPVIPRRYFAVVDASHGGDDHGETLSNTLLEKDVTVSLAHALKQELESRGLPTLVLRDSDANLSLDQRAASANSSHAAVYIALHASSGGQGVRIYTALLPYGDDDRGPFRSWTDAQRASMPLSQAAASAIFSEFVKRQIQVRTLSAPLRPLNNVTEPAVAVEVAPQGSDVAQLTAPDYQQLVTSAVATAIASSRDKLGAAP
jgi:N-acetylmuramoyl-L-alanine amidase